MNGLPALVNGNRFVANHIPLDRGDNIITVRALDTEGNTAVARPSVFAEAYDRHITLSSDAVSGISPMEVALDVEGNFPISESSVSYSGPGTAEFLEAGETYRIRLTTEGIHYFTAEAADTSPFTPVDTSVPGIFTCGCAQTPMDVPESVAQSSSAAERAAEVVTQSDSAKEKTVAQH